MNLSDEYNPRSRHHHKGIGDEWLNFCMEQPINPNAKMGAVWHLAVTLQSNNPETRFETMRTALRKWSCDINKDALNRRWAQKPDKQWRWIATYEDQPHDDLKTPHWHLIMTPGHGLPRRLTDNLLAVERTNRHIGKTRIILPQRLPAIRTTFAGYWQRNMPYGEIEVKFLSDPFDEDIWGRYIFKCVTGRKFTPLTDMRKAQSRVVIWKEFQNMPGI